MTAAALSEQFASLQATVEKLQRHVFGRRSEKITPLATAIRDPARAEAERIAALQTRRENAEKKRQLVTRKIEHKVREDQKVCPKCGGHDFSKLGDGAMTELYELVPAIVERQLHVQEKLRCKCGETVITADGPTRSSTRRASARPSWRRWRYRSVPTPCLSTARRRRTGASACR